ncbi:2-oxo-4-hydroxy-4-carboxy-5-ureidoimidazoline decarboxylase [Neobacillus muris]|uniref:2-oxo-4-hydroxy-4-carboxy-5-ureidoimidazoline decarboxylase n=1 Tax=Neobacillus muris TaxID=2941334 RepID=UPI00204092B8|nr:2-oxo-4-hydroxy-4-carboxy-5-ureidoimidazoline decarboxylase [Neobacillus muris]
MYTIDQINKTSHEEFMSITEGVFEHSPWISEKAEAAKPFATLQQLHAEMVRIVENATLEEKLSLLKAHPNLGGRVDMTVQSKWEQTGAGLQNLNPEENQKFIHLNQQYMEKFGYPFILAVRGKNKDEIYQSMETRIHNSKEMEFNRALSEVYQIALLRLETKICQ